MFNNYNYRPLSNLLTIKESSIHGLGLFATAYIPKFTNLGVSHYYNNFLIRTPLGGFINHSENINANIINSINHPSRHYLITLNNINKGEEILINYNLTSVAKYTVK
jgi:SET domain-containing protein